MRGYLKDLAELCGIPTEDVKNKIDVVK